MKNLQEQANVANETQVDSATTEKEVVTQETNADEQTEVQTVPLERFKEVYAKWKNNERAIEEFKSNNIAPQETVSAKEPKLEDYDFDETAYLGAMAEYKVEQKLKAIEQQRSAEDQKRRQDEVIKSFHEKAAEYAAKNEDYLKANENYDGVVFDNTIVNALYESEKGVELHHYLLKNPHEVTKLESMSPTQALMKIGQIEANLKKQKEIKRTSAPEPIETVTSSASLSSQDWNEAGISMEEYMKRRKAAGY